MAKSEGVSYSGNKIILTSTMVMIAQLCNYSKKYPIVHFKYVNLLHGNQISINKLKLLKMFRILKYVETGCRLLFAWLGLGRGLEVAVPGYEFSVKGDKNVQNLYCNDVFTTLETV